MIYRILIAGICLAVTFSCGTDDLEQAQESLIGSWTVDQIYTEIGEQLQNGQTPTFDTLDVGAAGSFIFDLDGTGDFSYSTLAVTITLEDRWSLQKSRVNCGFTNCDQYTLSIADDDYLCSFGDQTSDAHIDATTMKLSITEVLEDSYVKTVIDLKK